ncbi:MAG: alpha/beta hydrolase, partial [Chloroflexales bacterium]|nr:alpha/beta hydrolase [Chloroflexales bacterium]
PAVEPRTAGARWRIGTARGPISYLLAGEGAPLILLHGWGASAKVWGNTMGAVADLRSAYALDLPGFGESPARATTPTLAALADEVVAFADTLGLARFDLLGHSLGAAIAACVAGRHQERVGRLVVASLGARVFAPDLAALDITRPPLDMTLGLARPLFNLWQPVNRVVMQSPPLAMTMEAMLLHHRPSSDELWQSYLADHAAADARAYVTALTAVGDPALLDALRAIAAPTLCLAGREDRLSRLAETTTAHELIAGSTFVLLDDCGHVPMIEQPAAFNQAVRQFLG